MIACYYWPTQLGISDFQIFKFYSSTLSKSLEYLLIFSLKNECFEEIKKQKMSLELITFLTGTELELKNVVSSSREVVVKAVTPFW